MDRLRLQFGLETFKSDDFSIFHSFEVKRFGFDSFFMIPGLYDPYYFNSALKLLNSYSLNLFLVISTPWISLRP